MATAARPAETATDHAQLCMARQPIVDRQCTLVAYELLFRQPGKTNAVIQDSTRATLQVIANTFTNIGVDTVLGSKLAFINFDAELLQHELIHILPRQQIILEILENVHADEALQLQLQQLRDQQYRFALDDFILDEDTRALLKFADIIKVDISLLDQQTLIQYTEYGKQHNKQLLAEKVENNTQFELCKSLGFEFFQGYFFAKPVILNHADIPSGKMHIMNVMNLVMQEAGVSELERTLSHDLSLTYKLLKFINSAGLSCGRELTTISEAINMMGRDQLYRWLSLLLFTSDDSAPHAQLLMSSALYRGRLLELLAEESSLIRPSELFILGAFSYLEALLQRELRFILKGMTIPTPIRQALLEQSGDYWPFLRLAELIDSDAQQGALLLAQSLGLTAPQLTQAQLAATAYSESLNLH